MTAVEATQQPLEQDRPDGSAGTLGDVLYPDKSKATVSEAEWFGLVQAIATGDQVALHALYDRAHRVVFTLTMRLAGNVETAEEVTVDVFYDVWRRASAYDPANGTVLGWIMNQARSRAIDRVRFEQRKKRVAPGTPDASAPGTTVDSHEILASKEQGQVLRDALGALRPEERQAIETTFFSELTYAEAAARLNQPLGTLKTRIRAALHKLRQALRDGAEKT